MKLNKMKKRFFSLNRHNSEGFTLVELIVVIAILAILAGVGVPVYSGYIKQANMQADETLVSDVVNALQLYYYSHSDAAPNGYVILVPNGVDVEEPSNNVGTAAMNAAFGEGWEGSLFLKYDSWRIDYQNSSFSGKETVLLQQVDSLSGALAEAIGNNPNVIGNTFGNYLATNGLTDAPTEQKANAAVAYIAQNTSQSNSDSFLSYIANYGNGGTAGGLMSAAEGSYSGVTSIAAMYAFAEGYYQYEAKETGDTTGLDILHETFENVTVTDVNHAKTLLMQSLGEAFQYTDANHSELVAEYTTAKNGNSESQAVQDMKAYLDIMSTVHTAEDQVIEEIKTGNNFTNSDMITKFLNYYKQGGIIVAAKLDKNGNIEIANPLAGA